MFISVPWAIALTTAGVLFVLTLLGMGACAGRIRAPARALAHVAYLLAGGIIGFLSIAFFPAIPQLALITTLLVGFALRERRDEDVGLMLSGFGATWTLLLGNALLAQATDPAVHAADGTDARFLGGAAVLVLGLLILIRSALLGGEDRAS